MGHRYGKGKLIKAIVYQRCAPEQNWAYVDYRLWRWFYTLKAIAAVVLGREWTGHWMDCFDDDGVYVATLDYRPYSTLEYSGADWTGLHVGYGYLRNWHYLLLGDGYP